MTERIVKHTPGPLEVEFEDGVFFIITRLPNGVRANVAQLAARPNGRGQFRHNTPEVEANARLFAAASDLLEACKRAELLYAEYLALNPDPNSHSFEMVSGIVSSARAAIAKAEGRS